MSSLKGKAISRTYQKLIHASSEINDSTLKQIHTGEGVPTALRLSTTKAEVRSLGVGTGGANPDGLLHVMGVSAGAVTANTDANQLTLENSSNCGLSILAGVNHLSSIYFGSSNSNKSGKICYHHDSDKLVFSTDEASGMTLDSSGNLSVDGIISQLEDSYSLTEYFYDLPVEQVGLTAVTQQTNGTTAVTTNTRYTRLTTASIDLGATDSVEFTFNNEKIQGGSHVLAYFVNSSGTIADNAIISIMVHDVQDMSCKIRLGTNAVDVAAQTYLIHIVVDPHMRVNGAWGLTGTNVSELKITYSGTGVNLKTETSSGDEAILSPKDGDADVYLGGPHPAHGNISAWSGLTYSPVRKGVTLEMPITTSDSVADMSFWAGWTQNSSNSNYQTDPNKAYFLYSTDDTEGAMTNNGNLYFVYSISGTDYVTDLGITLEASTLYRLKISFDADDKASVFVNGVQYGLTSTSTGTTAGGVTESFSTSRSLALNEDTDLKPTLGIKTLTSSSKAIISHYIRATKSLT